MRGPRTIAIVGRRDFLIGAGSTAAIVSTVFQAFAANPSTPVPPSVFETALDAILGDTKAIAGKMVLELPEIAENGNTVPYAITVESPMTETNYVRSIHVLSTANPLANIASFKLTPMSGKAVVASRMRLAKTQDVVILAELSNGKFWLAQRAVKVTIGGCGG
jgi:sulfur-oxidizing protein SoxY